MGKIYKNKKRSCAMCKPYKRKWQDKKTPRDRAKQNQDEAEIKDSLKNE